MIYKLMVIDDEPILLEGLIGNIPWRTCGFELACTARNGIEGLEKYIEYQPDAILTDIRMRSMDGLEFIRQIRLMDEQTEIAVMSAYDVFEYAQQACKLGVTEYILKPILDEHLQKTLSNMHARLEKKKSISARLKGAEMYMKTQAPVLKEMARKQLLLGNHSEENFLLSDLAELGEGECLRAVMIQEFEARETPLLSVPASGLFEMELGVRVKLKAVFDSGAICLVVGVRQGELQGLEEALKATVFKVREKLKESLTVTMGAEVGQWDAVAESYCSAKRKMKLAQMLGLVGYAQVQEIPNLVRYPRELEKGLVNLSINPSDEAIEDWVREFGIWSEAHVGHFAMTARSIFLNVLSRMVEMNECTTTDYEEGRVKLENALSLPVKSALERLEEMVYALCGGEMRMDGLSGGYFEKTMAQVKFYALEHLDNSDLNIREIAEQVHMSAPYLGRVFKRRMGYSFNKYLNELRTEKACQLLLDGKMKVGEVSAAVGFDNQSYFQVQFKKKTGVTPGDYRKKWMENRGVEP